MDILVVSYLLILSSTLLSGTGIGTAFYLLMTSWTRGNSGDDALALLVDRAVRDAASCWLPVVWL